MYYAPYYKEVGWVVEIDDEFEPEFDELHEDVRTEILALTRMCGRKRAFCSSSDRNWAGRELTR